MTLVAKHDWPVGEFAGTVVTKYPTSVYVDGGYWGTYCALPDELVHPEPPPGEYVVTLALREDGKGSRVVALRPKMGVVVPLEHAKGKERFEEPTANLVKIGDATKFRVLILKASTLYTDKTRKTMRPNYGLAVVFDWDLLAKFLSGFKVGDLGQYPNPDIAKRQWGGWVGGEFKNNHRTVEAFLSTRLLIVDVDGRADIERLAWLLRRYRVIIHTTFKSSKANPRARVVFMLSGACADAGMYKVTHAVVRSMLTSRGFVLDDGASDCSRLNFIPMHQPGYVPRFHMHDGDLLDIANLVRPSPEPEPATPRAASTEGEPRDGYRKAALRRAHDNLAAAVEGTRHDTLVREAWSLSRPELGLTIQGIEEALLPAYQHDLADGKRTIRDEFRARRRRIS